MTINLETLFQKKAFRSKSRLPQERRESQLPESWFHRTPKSKAYPCIVSPVFGSRESGLAVLGYEISYEFKAENFFPEKEERMCK